MVLAGIRFIRYKARRFCCGVRVYGGKGNSGEIGIEGRKAKNFIYDSLCGLVRARGLTSTAVPYIPYHTLLLQKLQNSYEYILEKP